MLSQLLDKDTRDNDEIRVLKKSGTTLSAVQLSLHVHSIITFRETVVKVVLDIFNTLYIKEHTIFCLSLIPFSIIVLRTLVVGHYPNTFAEPESLDLELLTVATVFITKWSLSGLFVRSWSDPFPITSFGVFLRPT